MNKQPKSLNLSKEQFITGIKKRAKFLREREEFLNSKKPRKKITIDDIPEIKDEELAVIPPKIEEEINENLQEI
jgi:hypothetical protein